MKRKGQKISFLPKTVLFFLDTASFDVLTVIHYI